MSRFLVPSATVPEVRPERQPNVMIYFAYDGSMNGDWVSHYAVRLAGHDADKTLHLVHAYEPPWSAEAVENRLSVVGEECERADVHLVRHLLPIKSNVLTTIDPLIPHGRDIYVVCGMRIRAGHRGILERTVSDALLRRGGRNVLAIRVVQPGLLGDPRNYLVPVSGHPRGFQSGMSFLRLLAPDIAALHILFVQRIAGFRFGLLSHEQIERSRLPGQSYCHRVERELAEKLAIESKIVDTNVAVAEDVAEEIVHYANKVKAGVIYLGASERNLTERLLYGNPIEKVLRNAPCDVAVYRGVP